jgi:hypothetical protein
MTAVAIKREEVAPAVATLHDPWLLMIQRVAADPTVDIARLEQLYALKDRADKAKAERQFAAAMAVAQAEIAPVAKNKSNDFTKSKYADLAAIADAVQPIYSRNGFALTFGVEQSSADMVTVVCDIIHADGHSRRISIVLPLDNSGSGGKVNKTTLQATGSTITYGRRYLTCMAFNVAIADVDGNRPKPQEKPPELISEEQFVELANLIRETNSDIEKFLELGGLENLGDMRAADFAGAKAMLLKKQAKQAVKS